MTIQHVEATYGPTSRNRPVEAVTRTPEGARAALESFYYALNHRDATALRQTWSTHPLAQLNNPVGGILRGGTAVGDFYQRVFDGPVRLEITFGDVVEYLADDHAVFAGRETGRYVVDGADSPLAIRTSRYFRYVDGRWQQFHHHGSIDDPAALGAYQAAIAG